MRVLDIGSRIKLARSMKGMSQRAVAESAGISATAVSKFERDLAQPRPSTLMRIARALSTEIEFFFKETRVRELRATYRKHSRLGLRSQRQLEAEVVNAVEKYMSIEEVFPEDFAPDSDLPRYSVTSEEDAECAAQMIRSRWNLGAGPVDDLTGRLEGNFVKVVEVRGIAGFDGFSCWVNGEEPIIAFNGEMPGERQRFSLSHELGHLVLQVEEQSLIEMVANRFAAAFLISREAALSELGSRRKNLSFEELLLLKQEYGVSIQWWIRRAYDLNIISTDTYSTLFRRLSSMGWRTCEPIGIPAEKPRRLRLLVHRALAEDLITDTFAAKVLGEVRRSVPRDSDPHLKRDAQDLATVYENDEELTWLTDADLEEEPDDRTE